MSQGSITGDALEDALVFLQDGLPTPSNTGCLSRVADCVTIDAGRSLRIVSVVEFDAGCRAGHEVVVSPGRLRPLAARQARHGGPLGSHINTNVFTTEYVASNASVPTSPRSVVERPVSLGAASGLVPLLVIVRHGVQT